MRLLLTITCLLIATAGLWAQQTINPKFEEKIENTIDNSVTTISCERLSTKMNTPNLYILDAREKNEFNVSHLKGAKWIGYNTFTTKNVEDVPKDAIVVIYCSIGYRSEKVGEQLKKAGFSKVYNLYGGIFEWCNREYKVVDKEQKETAKVHAYDRDWGRWVEKGDKVFK